MLIDRMRVTELDNLKDSTCQKGKVESLPCLTLVELRRQILTHSHFKVIIPLLILWQSPNSVRGKHEIEYRITSHYQHV